MRDVEVGVQLPAAARKKKPVLLFFENFLPFLQGPEILSFGVEPEGVHSTEAISVSVSPYFRAE